MCKILWEMSNTNFTLPHLYFIHLVHFLSAKSDQDYGTIRCMGRNAVGRQVRPCTFDIKPTSKICMQFEVALW